MKLESLRDLYVEQLRDLYSAEKQLIDAMPKMMEAASNPQLKKAFEEHLAITRQHKERIEQICQDLGEKPTGETCKAMKGLIQEAQSMLKEDAEPEVLDAGLITAAQRIEHYEIAGYGTVASYAEILGRRKDRTLLNKTLQDEKKTDKLLNEIALTVVNPQAV